MPLVVNGWTLLYHEVFGQRYNELAAEARRLKRELTELEFVGHPTVKLAASVFRLITAVIPADPEDPRYYLRGDLTKFRRAKGQGMPPCYRLFFVFSRQARTIIYLYLNDDTTLGKEGSSTDPYVVFGDLVRRGLIGADFEQNLLAWEEASEPSQTAEEPPAQQTVPRRPHTRRRPRLRPE